MRAGYLLLSPKHMPMKPSPKAFLAEAADQSRMPGTPTASPSTAKRLDAA